jgi:hypothetical protein
MKINTLIIVVLAVVTMFALGWISFQRTDTEANITIDTREIKQDTEIVIETGKELIDDAKNAIDEATTDGSAADHQSTPKPRSVD